MHPSPMIPALSEEQFHIIRDLLQRLCGIALHAGKEGLVKTRLAKRLRALHMQSFAQYLTYLGSDSAGQEVAIMMDALTTNKTSFFREPQHFAYLRQYVVPQWLAQRGRQQLWSAGCSSGEEPYSLAIVLRHAIPDLDHRAVRILATDISPSMLAVARRAVYDQDALRQVPAHLVQTYFTSMPPAPPSAYQVNANVRSLVHLAQLNLIGAWPMHGPFSGIFCRNVMIYFDKRTKQRLLQRFWDLLVPGGFLFIGHAESLVGMSQPFRYVQPAIHIK